MLIVSGDKIEFEKWIACPLCATVGYDEHACDTIIFFSNAGNWRTISEINSHQILQELSELWSCIETRSWQFELKAHG